VKYPANWDKRKIELKHGMLGYDTAVEYLDGRIELCSSTRSDMLPHIILSGKTIDRLCVDYSITSFQVLNGVFSYRTSRLDLALDIKQGTLDIQALKKDFDDGKADTLAQKRLHMTGTQDYGETLYVGAPKASKRLRVYDKAAEQGLQDTLWTRVELQLRHKHATAACNTLFLASDPHKLVSGMINQFCAFPSNREWMVALGSDKVKVSTETEYESNRKKWLFDTCIAAMVKEMIASGDGETLLNAFDVVVRRKYEIVLSQYKD
jgi:DNA relaxase NicK